MGRFGHEFKFKFTLMVDTFVSLPIPRHGKMLLFLPDYGCVA